MVKITITPTCYCVDCGKKLAKSAFYQVYKYCGSCAAKRRETKRQIDNYYK